MANSLDLHEVFILDDSAWSPRPAVYRVAVAWAQSTDRTIPTNRQVFTALRSRGFRETKRRGVLGFAGIYTAPELAASPALSRVPGTSAAYDAGDRSPESIEAMSAYRTLNSWQPADSRVPYDPFAVHESPTSLASPAIPVDLDLLADSPTFTDGYSVSTRVTRVLVSRAEARWGPAPSWRCVYCDAPATTVDHFQPWSISRDSRPANLVPCCPRCQNAKLAKRPAEFLASIDLDSAIASHLLAIADDPTWQHPSACA